MLLPWTRAGPYFFSTVSRQPDRTRRSASHAVIERKSIPYLTLHESKPSSMVGNRRESTAAVGKLPPRAQPRCRLRALFHLPQHPDYNRILSGNLLVEGGVHYVVVAPCFAP